MSQVTAPHGDTWFSARRRYPVRGAIGALPEIPMSGTLQRAWEWAATMPHLVALLAVGWAVYLLVLGVWIVLQKREPVATLSWLFGLALLPYVGFLVYHVFGPQKIHRNRLRRTHSRAALRSTQIEAESGEGAELVRLGQATTGLPATSSAQVDLLVDGAAKYTALPV